MFGFLKAIWRFFSTAKSVVGTLIFIGIVAVIGIALFRDGRPTIPDGSALVVTLDGVVVEQRVEPDPFSALAGGAEMPDQTLLRDVLEALNRASTDDRIKAVVLDLDGFFGGGAVALEEIGAALAEVKRANKPIIAYATFMGDPQYYVAAHASEIILNDMGLVALTGYGAYRLYFKEALDRLNVKVEVFQAGRYKNFAEPFFRSGMSAESRESETALLDGLWQDYLEDVRAQRGAKGTDLPRYISTLAQGPATTGGDMAKFALNAKVVDALGNRETLADRLVKLVGEGENPDGEPSFNQIHMDAYLAGSRSLTPETGDAIAVVYAVGTILDGEHPSGTAGGATLSRLIHTAAANEDVKAIVLRIDSPGGSAFASEEIRLALAQAQKDGIPVVASMGSLAASGGYWIAATADEIIASPATITGSIGVIGVLPTVDATLADYGVRSDGTGTTPFSDAGDITRPLQPQVRDLLQANLMNTYQRFIGLVAQGRKSTPEAINAIAQGRVWAGGAAHQQKLVDRLGSLDDAVQSAAKRAKLTSWRIMHVEEPESWETKLLRRFFSSGVEQSATPVQAPFAASGWALNRPVRQVAEVAQLLTTSSPVLMARCVECSAFSVSVPTPAQTRAQTTLSALLVR
jgi:protease-4